jgi:DNA-binding phage protein
MRQDPDLFARIIGDILKSEGRGSTPGKRPNLNRSEAEDKLNKLAGDDYSEFPFQQAFKILCGSRSIRSVANKTGLSPTKVFRMLDGQHEPDFETMEASASTFRQDPSYFLEYRVGRIQIAITRLLFDSPETATAWYSRIFR